LKQQREPQSATERIDGAWNRSINLQADDSVDSFSREPVNNLLSILYRIHADKVVSLVDLLHDMELGSSVWDSVFPG